MLSFCCKEELFLSPPVPLYLLLSAWSFGFLLHARGQNIFLSLFILMLDLSLFCHVSTSWPIHLCALPALSFFSGIGGSCFSLLSVPFPSGPLHCPVQGSTPYFVISVNGAPGSCAVHSLGSRTQLCIHTFWKIAKLSIFRKITIPSAFPIFLIRDFHEILHVKRNTFIKFSEKRNMTWSSYQSYTLTWWW